MAHLNDTSPEAERVLVEVHRRMPLSERWRRIGLQDFAEVGQIFDRLGISYALGGSMASSLYGITRHTNDADVTVEKFPGKEAKLIEALGPDYYIGELRSTFNIINTVTGFKVDVFLLSDDLFERSAMSRRTLLEIDGRRIFVHTAEDVILFKLRWYRLGDEVSVYQWKDVLNVMKVQGANLDRDYLDRWAPHLKVGHLLQRAWCEVSPS